MTVLRLPVEQLSSANQVVLPKLGPRPVLRVNHFDDGTYVVVYADSTLNCWENRAKDKGRWNRVNGQFEKSLRPLRAGELVEVAR